METSSKGVFMKNTGGMHIRTQIYINLTFKNIPLLFCRNPKKLDCLYIQKNLTEVMKYKRVLKGLSRALNSQRFTNKTLDKTTWKCSFLRSDS